MPISFAADGPMSEALTFFVRTLIIYLLLLFVIRLMGKREIGNLSPIDLVVTIMIADAAIIAVQEKKPLWVGIVPVLTLVLAEIILSYLSLKNIWIRKIVTGQPSIIIEKGIINEKAMRQQRYNIDDLMSQLREKNLASITDVEYAILEPNGKLSVIPKSSRRSVMPADLSIDVPSEEMPLEVISDGAVIHSNLKRLGLSLDWLKQELKKRDVKNPKEILLATADTQGRISLQKK